MEDKSQSSETKYTESAALCDPTDVSGDCAGQTKNLAKQNKLTDSAGYTQDNDMKGSEYISKGTSAQGVSSMDVECTDPESVNMEYADDCEDVGAESCNGNAAVKLLDLPAELMFYLASFLDSRDIIESLCHVCQYLRDLFSDERYWKTRINMRWPKPYPVLEREDFNWCVSCMEREEVHKKWSQPEEHFHHIVCKEGFYASVDVVHLMKEGRYLAVGSRDRYMNVLDLSRYDCDNPNNKKVMSVFSNGKVHKGWVWSMASYDDTLLTGSWDTHIRFWDLGQGAVEEAADVKLKTAILGLYAEPGFVAACGYDKRLYMFDPRTPYPDSLIKKRYHDQPILCVAADDKYVITGSEDKVVSIYDRAAGKNYKKIDTDSFVMDMCYGLGQLWIGDKEGRLKLIDARDGLFDENNIQTFEIGHKGKVTGVVYTDGGIFTCSTDSTLKVLEPTLEPGTIKTLTTHTEAVAGISYQNGILASAGSDISVGIWLPKTHRF